MILAACLGVAAVGLAAAAAAYGPTDAVRAAGFVAAVLAVPCFVSGLLFVVRFDASSDWVLVFVFVGLVLAVAGVVAGAYTLAHLAGWI